MMRFIIELNERFVVIRNTSHIDFTISLWNSG